MKKITKIISLTVIVIFFGLIAVPCIDASATNNEKLTLSVG